MRARISATKASGCRDVVRILADPRFHLFGAHLRVKLHAPGVPEPERLRADAAARQLDGPGRERVRVVVPLEGVEPLGQRSRDRIVRRGRRALDRKPADLRLARAEDLGAGRPGDEL